MNKTKLEVIRINEDVITTSGIQKVCEHIDKGHLFISNYTGSKLDYVSYSSTDEKLECEDGSTGYDASYLSGVTTNGWYAITGPTTYVKCDNDCIHPIKQ